MAEVEYFVNYHDNKGAAEAGKGEVNDRLPV